MKFSLERDTFAKVLKKVDGVCSSRGTFAILDSCMIEARNSSIVVTGTDLEITLRVVESANIIEEGVAIVDARRLLDTVQRLGAGDMVTFSTSNSQVLVEAGNFHGHIPAGDIAEFPQIPSIDIRETLSMSGSVFKDLINKTMFSISRDDSRPEFTGAFLTISQNGQIQLVSTDGHRLSRAEGAITIDGTLDSVFETGVIIPRKGLAEIVRNLEADNITLDISSNKFIIGAGSMMFYINIIAGQFPDFSKVTPRHLDHKAVVNREMLQQILRRAAIFTSKTGTVKITLSNGRIEISTFDTKTGEMTDFVEADYEGSGVLAGFNWKYIDEILSVIGSEQISLEIIDMDSPAVIRDTESDKFDFIIMPMQL